MAATRTRSRYLDPSTGEHVVERGAPRDDATVASDVVLALRTKRGSCATDPDFGSRLHTIKKLTNASRRLAEVYAREAIAHLIDRGEVRESAFISVQNAQGLVVTVAYRNAAGRSALPVSVPIA